MPSRKPPIGRLRRRFLQLPRGFQMRRRLEPAQGVPVTYDTFVSFQVGSQCMLLTDNYCEDAYELLQTPMLKKLLLSGILLDTQNLNVYSKLSMARDTEAIQLLLVIMQDERDSSFVEAVQHNYGKPHNDGDGDNRLGAENTPSNLCIEASTTNSDKNSNHARTPKVNKSPRGANARGARGCEDDED
ncbi:Detected protein of unknown function [Hibiscus syriacus]|uniref:Uncharacterized protein n=1 Tax=Hibiscus syriacus TaxID=106335 RepID=A0A6A3ALL3_HIBSY|nr:Detected protein of unknown function [Hibiscus syriacus]